MLNRGPLDILDAGSDMRIVLDKTRLQILMIAVPLALVIAAGAYYYFYVWPRQGLSHEPFLVPDTAVRVVIKPPQVQSYISSLAPAATRFVKGVPKFTSLQQFSFRTEWVHKMPFEFSLLLDQRSPDYLGVLLFVQENPASESFADLLNDSRFFHALHPIRWEQPRMMRRGTGQLTASGTLPIPAAARDAVSARFPDFIPLDPPQVSGRHFVEIAVNNRNGSLMELQGALSRLAGILNNRELEDSMLRLWAGVESAHLSADLEGDDRVGLHMEIVCQETRTATIAAEAIQEIADAINMYLNARFGFLLQGTAYPEEEAKVSGNFTLTGFEERLRNALGG